MDANVLFLKYEDMHKVGYMQQRGILIAFSIAEFETYEGKKMVHVSIVGLPNV